MRRIRRAALLFLCLLCLLSGCGADRTPDVEPPGTPAAPAEVLTDPVPAEPAQSTPYSGMWTLQSIPLFDHISLEEDLELQVLGGSRGAVLVAVEGRLPETSPYYDDVRLENGLTVYTDRVHLVSFPEGEVLHTVAFQGEPVCCVAGAVGTEEFALAVREFSADGEEVPYQIVCYSRSGEDSRTAVDGTLPYEKIPLQLVLTEPDGVVCTFGPREMGGPYGFLMAGRDGGERGAYSIDPADGSTDLEFLNSTLRQAGDGFLFDAYTDDVHTLVLGDSGGVVQEVQVEAKADSSYSAAWADGNFLLARQGSIRLVDTAGETVAETGSAAGVYRLTGGDGIFMGRGGENLQAVTVTEAGVKAQDTGIDSRYREWFYMGEGRFLVWNYGDDTAAMLYNKPLG